jgi:hypothetical protein
LPTHGSPPYLSVPCRLGTSTYKFQVKIKSGRATVRHHVFHSSGSCLSAEVGSGAATCPVALEPASLLRMALVSPRVSWLQTHGEDSGAPHVLWLGIIPPCREGSELPRVLWSPMGRRLKHEERPSRLAYVARLLYSQRMHAHFQGG